MQNNQRGDRRGAIGVDITHGVCLDVSLPKKRTARTHARTPPIIILQSLKQEAATRHSYIARGCSLALHPHTAQTTSGSPSPTLLSALPSFLPSFAGRACLASSARRIPEPSSRLSLSRHSLTCTGASCLMVSPASFFLPPHNGIHEVGASATQPLRAQQQQQHTGSPPPLG